jgi:diaminopropionate ammonia-lyase
VIRLGKNALLNRAVDVTALREEAERVLPASLRAAAQDAITLWPGYSPTPMHDLAGLAAKLGISRLWCKDEASRFGLGSFKALGGAYAVGLQARDDPGSTVACATEGNHGRSVAWGAKRHGLRCVIFLHEGVSKNRENAIAQFGAEIRRVPGAYDDAVRICAAEAEENGWAVVSDTSWPGYSLVPQTVMAGYTVMTAEIRQALKGEKPPTHIFIQGGVGGLAAAAIADLSAGFPPETTRYVLVEPDSAACLLKSLAEGKPSAAPGPFDTIMAGLACGEASGLAFPVLKAGASAALAIDDEKVVKAMRIFAQGIEGDPTVVAGASGAAGLAGVLVALENKDLAESLSLGATSRILVINTEGATDPEMYDRHVKAGSE